MLEGLEICELRLSEVNNQSIDFRIESEYFKKEYRELNFKLKSKKYFQLSYFLNSPIQTGHTPSMRESENYGGDIKFIKTDNLRDNYIKPDFNHYLSERGNQEIIRTFLKPKDILTTIIGATFDVIARSCIIYEEILPANINQNIALIRVNQAKINPEFLNLYLNTKFGKGYLRYLSRQTEQVNLNCREVEQLLVPVLDEAFQREISLTVIKAHEYADKSKIKYQQAEHLLLQELGITNTLWQTKGLAVNNKSFQDSFADSGRLDAEYYQPKYEAIMQVARFGGTEAASLDAFVEIKKSIEPGSDAYQETGIPFLRVSNISKLELTETDIYLDETLYGIEALYPKKDTILLTKDGSVGLAYKVEEDIKAITSSALLHLKVIDTNVILPDYLTLVLNSPVVQLQAERDCGGSIIQHWRIDEIKKVMIPLLEMSTQQQIASLIQQSFQLRKQSKHLLEIAKQAVEMAIETDEATAMDFIKANTD